MNISEINPLEIREISPNTRPDSQFVRRWSPRAMSGASVSVQEIKVLIEAARWAPSCFNAQPWRFAYVLKESDAWASVFNALVAPNQAWATHCGALLGVISRTQYEHNDKPAPTHSFDAGAAWMSIALQASTMGLVAHGMQGFDQQAARAALAVPEVYDLPALIAIGHPGELETLPEDYRERETPSPRKPLDEILFKDDFGGLFVSTLDALDPVCTPQTDAVKLLIEPKSKDLGGFSVRRVLGIRGQFI